MLTEKMARWEELKMDRDAYLYAIASGRIDPFDVQGVQRFMATQQRKQAQTYFLPADPEAVWGESGDGKKILVSRIENMLDAGAISFLKRSDAGTWYIEKPASLQEMRLHGSRLSAAADAETNEARKFSLQARRDLLFKAICQRAQRASNN